MPNIVADFPASPPPPADGKLKLHNTLARNVKIISFLFFLLSKAHCPTRFKAYSGSSIQREGIRSSDKQGPCLRFCTFKHIWSYCERLCWKKTQISDEENMKSSRENLWGCVRSFYRQEMLKQRETNKPEKRLDLLKDSFEMGAEPYERSNMQTKDKSTWTHMDAEFEKLFFFMLILGSTLERVTETDIQGCSLQHYL